MSGQEVTAGGKGYHVHGVVAPEVSQGYALGKAQEIAWQAGKTIHTVCGPIPAHLMDSVEFSFHFGLDGGEMEAFPGRPEKPTEAPSDHKRKRGGKDGDSRSVGSGKALKKS